MNRTECTAEAPLWLIKGKLNEMLFCEDFLQKHPMVRVGGSFFTKDGRVTDEEAIRKEIYEMLRPYLSMGLPRRASSLLEQLKLEAYAPNLPVHEDRIHVQTAHCFWTVRLQNTKTFAAIVCPSAIALIRRSLPHGCDFYRSFWKTKIS